MAVLRVAGEMSTQIKNDLLVANFQLDQIESAKTTLDIPKILKENVQVYSSNREVIMKTMDQFSKHSSCPPWEQYVQENQASIKDFEALDRISGEQLNAFIKLEKEASEMANLNSLMDHLAEKITRAIDRAQVPHLSVQKMPTPPTSFHLVLRKEPAPRQVVEVKVNAACPEGAVVGFCSAPAWGDEPKVFTGEVPLNTEFKFVLMKDGKVIAWENGNNRIMNERKAFTFNEVSF